MSLKRYRPPRSNAAAVLLPEDDEDLELLATLEDRDLAPKFARQLVRAKFLGNSYKLEVLRANLRLRGAHKGALKEQLIRMAGAMEPERRPVEDRREE